MAISFEISEKMIEEVYREWETEHPGMTAASMSPGEFSDRLMKKMKMSIHSDQPGHA